MLLGKKRKLGRKVESMSVGEKLKLTEKIEDKDLLLYLGLTNDGNPLYIQHDFASQTSYEKPIVPAIMLTGIVTSAISKYLPGPGSHIVDQQISFPKPVYHYATIDTNGIVALQMKDVDTVNQKENYFQRQPKNNAGTVIDEFFFRNDCRDYLIVYIIY